MGLKNITEKEGKKRKNLANSKSLPLLIQSLG